MNKVSNTFTHLASLGRREGSTQHESELQKELSETNSKLSSLYAELEELNGRVTDLQSQQNRIANATSYASPEYLAATVRAAYTKGTNILLAGWYGAGNLGDELMLRSVLSHLPQEALRRTTVLLWNNTAYERFSLDLRVHVIHYPRTTWELEQLADTFDVVVWGGGAILDDKQFDNNPANFNTGNIFIRLNELMLARRKQVWCLGLSCNTSFSKREYLSHLLNIVSHSQHFSLRDPFSFDLLVSVGMPKEHLSRCEDLVFGLPELNAIATTIRKSPPTKLEPTQQNKPFTLGFALMNIGTLVDSYTETIQNALTSSARFMNKPVRGLLIPSFGSEDYDSELNIKICHRLQERGLPVEVAPYTLSITKSPLAECDAVVCYKYHAALIAATMDIPVLAVILTQHPHYANKMRYLAQLGGFEKWALTSDEFKDNLDETMRRFLMQLPRPSLPATIYQQTKHYLDKVCAALGNS